VNIAGNPDIRAVHNPNNLGIQEAELETQTLKIPEIVRLTPEIFRDERGFFSETYNCKRLEDAGIVEHFVQDNHSLSADRHVVRGLHYQLPPHAQAKLVRVARGMIFDVAVDIRKGSPTFGQHVSSILSSQNWRQLWIPKGFAHGFCTLEPETEVIYKVSDYYAPDCDRGLAWDDPELGIDWPVTPGAAILSEKDSHHPRLAEVSDRFLF